MDKNGFFKKAEELGDYLVNIRRHLHENPEIGFELQNTKKFVKDELEKIGLCVNEVGKCGLSCVIGGKKEGKTFLLRADMDALPIKEESDVSFKSKNENMHACGHDMHTAMLIGAAHLLKEYENDIDGTVKLMFQSAEETFEGSDDMIKAGILKNPDVDFALMIHVMANIPLKPGTAIVSPKGVTAPSADYFQIEVKGQGSHGSMPNLGVDSLLTASHILIALQEINSRELGLSEDLVLTVGTMNGGTAPNAIADKTVMKGTLRAYDEEVRNKVKSRIEEISKGISNAFRCDTSVSYTSSCPTLLNDELLSSKIYEYLKELLGEGNAFSASELAKADKSGGLNKMAGSEDFSYISHEVPSIMIALCAGEPQNGFKYPQHHPMVKFDEEALSKGSAIYAYSAIRYLQENK